MAPTDNDLKSELSYAYLHAVASGAGCACEMSHRLVDYLGIDARLTASGNFALSPSLTLFDVYVQLKATSQQLALVDNCYSLRIEKALYEKMRVTTVSCSYLLVLLLLPEKKTDWLRVTPSALTLKRCAYWVSLRGAPSAAVGPDNRLTVRIPKRNRFHVDSLQKLLVRSATEDWVTYEE